MNDVDQDNVVQTANEGPDVADTNREDEMCGCTVVCCSYKSERCECGMFQSWVTIKLALCLLCMGQLLYQGVAFGLLSVSISTLEKRFELQSIESGLIASSYDITAICALVFISFMGEDVHKPSWLGWGLAICGAGCLLFTLPHFISPPYIYVEEEIFNFCGNVTASDCTRSSLRNSRYIFMLAMGIFGIGGNPLFTHGTTYLDENVKKDLSALYTGIYFAMAGLGPALGFIFGGATLELFTDFHITRDELTIDSGSYAWIGAWWLGYLVCGAALVTNAIPMLMLPRYIPGTRKHRINRNLEVHKTMIKKNDKDENKKKSIFSQRWSDIKLLMRNKPYIFMVLGCTVNSAFIFGFNTFGAKYLESIFDLTAFQSAILYGTTAIFASMGGQLVGGLVVAKFRLSVQGILKVMIVTAVFSTLCSLAFFVHCPDIDFAGGTVPYINETLSQSPTASCNMNCGCSTDRYEPVCGEDGITYFSPCFAGCTTKLNETVYTNCSCIPSISNTSSENNVYTKSCDEDSCYAIIPFIFVVFICFFSSILTIPMASQVQLRCVPFHNRTMAISLQRAVVLALGVVPGRILTGTVLDLACVSWSTECGEQGSCRVYQRWNLARNATLLLLAQTIISFSLTSMSVEFLLTNEIFGSIILIFSIIMATCLVFYSLVYVTYKPPTAEPNVEEGESSPKKNQNSADDEGQVETMSTDVV